MRNERERVGGRDIRVTETPQMRRNRIQRVQELMRDNKMIRREPVVRITREDPEQSISESTQDTQLASLTGRFSEIVIAYGHTVLGSDTPPRADIEPYTIHSDSEAA
jgi:hypothetical protein